MILDIAAGSGADQREEISAHGQVEQDISEAALPEIASTAARALGEIAAMNPLNCRAPARRLPKNYLLALRRLGFRQTRHLLVVKVARQRMAWFETGPNGLSRWRSECVVSTSAWGTGQVMNSNRTPLGLHRVANKIGGGHPIGTVFRGRVAIGYTWRGLPEGTIAHRILWLEGLEPGFNRGGNVDTHARFIYIHGFGDESTLGRPNSHGCVHVAAADLMPLFERLPTGTLVWIEA